jgi:hypothetical protein
VEQDQLFLGGQGFYEFREFHGVRWLGIGDAGVDSRGVEYLDFLETSAAGFPVQVGIGSPVMEPESPGPGSLVGVEPLIFQGI